MKLLFTTLLSRVRTLPRWYFFLGGTILLGIFLRTYAFRDWMIFNPDQARDALLVQDMLAGKVWPLLGPQAGNTYFSLGPIFYYFQYASAWLFGSSAERMAYPDLLFSVLAIPLFFVFTRRFFTCPLSLVLTFLFTTSFFVVTYSRFAFNPNAIPFFTLLFFLALLQILDHAPRERFGWAALLGVAMGVGFQLHTILFIAMPFLALLSLGYLFLRRQFVWRSVLLTLFFFAVVNAGQLISEIQNHGDNLQSFFASAENDARGTGNNLVRNFSNDILCHIQGEMFILTSLGSGDKCDLTKLSNRVTKRGWMVNRSQLAIAGGGAVLVFGGLSLLLWSIRKEQDMRRKRGLVLVAVYSLIVFAILFSVSSSVSIRYFIVIEFVPFLFLGLWLQLLFKRVPYRYALLGAGALVFTIGCFNFQSFRTTIESLRLHAAGDDNVAYFGEVALMSQYVLERSPDAQVIYLSGKASYLSRYGKPLEYFGKQRGVTVSKAYKLNTLTPQDAFFYVVKRITKKDVLPNVRSGFRTVDAFTIGNVSVLQLVREGE